MSCENQPKIGSGQWQMKLLERHFISGAAEILASLLQTTHKTLACVCVGSFCQFSMFYYPLRSILWKETGARMGHIFITL
jgi:hypothetical protein